MAKAQQDTEITLGTGRMLAIFFSFVLVCAFFFGTGFSLGRRTASSVSGVVNAASGVPAAIVRPSPAKNGAGTAQATQANPQATDFSFYNAVGAKSGDAAQTAAETKTPVATVPTTASTTVVETAANSVTNTVTNSGGPAATAEAGYFVQVAAVSRQEDAESLVEALKKKQYPAFAANNASVDKFFHVQVGPYADLKGAEAMKARLVGDGYNPIVKK